MHRISPCCIVAIFALGACSPEPALNCFELLDREHTKSVGHCVAQGQLRLSFEDYFFERSPRDSEDFLIIDASSMSGEYLSAKVGGWYTFEGKYRRLEGNIYRLEVHSEDDLITLDSGQVSEVP